MRRPVRQSKVREKVRKEGGCRTQDTRDGCPHQDMRRDDQAVGLSHGICSRRWDDGPWLARMGTNRAEKQDGWIDGTGPEEEA